MKSVQVTTDNLTKGQRMKKKYSFLRLRTASINLCFHQKMLSSHVWLICV